LGLPVCTQANTTCVLDGIRRDGGSILGGTCQACGGLNQRCCMNGTCDGTLRCTISVATGQQLCSDVTLVTPVGGVVQ
jgi:hypothetical protein